MGAKKFAFFMMLFLVIVPFTFAKTYNVTLFLFWGQGCPHCAKMKTFLGELVKEYPSLEVKEYEVYFNQSNRKLFEKVAKAYNTTPQGVPTVFIGRKVFVGYSDEIASQIEETIKECITQECSSPEEIINNSMSIPSPPNPPNYTNERHGVLILFIMVSILFILIILTVLLNKRKR